VLTKSARGWSSLPVVSAPASLPDLEAISGLARCREVVHPPTRLKQCGALRKLHLRNSPARAVCRILHCVFFPDPRFDLPVFGMPTSLAGPGRVSAAIADRFVPPVHPACRHRHWPGGVAGSTRFSLAAQTLPALGTIFSPFVALLVRPVTPPKMGLRSFEEVQGAPWPCLALGRLIEASEQPPGYHRR